MNILLKVQKNKRDLIVSHIKKNRRLFPRIQGIKKYNSIYIVVSYPSDYTLNVTQMDALKAKYGRLTNVYDVTIDLTDENPVQHRSLKNFHFIFDVDSTLTSGRTTIQSKVRNIFRKMKESGHRVYLASGRSETQLRQDMKDFDSEPIGIAENGGILIGLGNDGHLIIGDRAEPDKVLAYMKNKCNTVKEDIGQGMRITERIFKATIPQNKFGEYVKESKASVDVLASKNAYHVAKKQINKGSALERLRTELRFGEYDVVVGVGDSDLDIPLFQESDHKFAVGNASSAAKKNALTLAGRYADGIEEMYETYFR